MAKARGDSIGLPFVDAVLLHTCNYNFSHYRRSRLKPLSLLFLFPPVEGVCVCAHAHVHTYIDVVEGEGSENEALLKI